MPIYEFHCESCDKHSEILVRSTRSEGTKCPHCGSTKLTKQFSSFATSAGGGGGETSACESGPAKRDCACASGRPHRH